MYKYFYEKYNNFLIEANEKYLIYLISGKKLKDDFQWYGMQRAKAFNKLSRDSIVNDIEERDIFFSHMILWDKETKELAGGQRFLYSKKGCMNNKHYSYLEHYHPGIYEHLKTKAFAK